MTESLATVALAGATGLVGQRCLTQLLEVPGVEHVMTLGRRSPAVDDTRVSFHAVDFACLDEEPQPPRPLTAALCALGTTMKRAGSEAAFRAVDHDAVLAFATWARRHDCPLFVLVSSVGADTSSRNLYLRVKGEVEATIARLGYTKLVILRPGLLLGPRTESRPAEALARALMPAFTPLLRGRLERYRGVHVDAVAAAMVAAARAAPVGVHTWHNREITRAAGTSPP